MRASQHSTRHSRAARLKHLLHAPLRILEASTRRHRLEQAFRTHVAPLLDSAVAVDKQRNAIEDALIPSSVAGGNLLESYARLVSRPPNPRLAILAGAFTRLYDDMFDNFDDPSVDERLSALFAERPLNANNDHERLLEAVFTALQHLAPRTSHAPSYQALTELHHSQTQSRRQTRSDLSDEEMWEITLAKGGRAMLVLASLVRPEMDDAEQAILYRLGGLLQLIDDYRDITQDRLQGRHTPATRGQLPYAHLRARLHDVTGALHTYYGENAGPFTDSLSLWLDLNCLRRALRRHSPRHPRSAQRTHHPAPTDRTVHPALFPLPAAWREMNAECERAAHAFQELRDHALPAVLPQLSGKEQIHLQHTAFRINALLFRYARLRRTTHDTQFGVLLGAITHLLDHVYDHRSPQEAQLREIEDVVLLRRAPDPTDALAVALARLSGAMWPQFPRPAALRRRLEDMLQTQRRTLMQAATTPLGPDTLRLLTRDKGHHSLCLYFAAVNPHFDAREASALVSFGSYMQYMDDLEDCYEDQMEGRQSLARGITRGALRSTTMLRRAWRDLATHYANNTANDYRNAGSWIIGFHLGMLTTCALRELTRRLPLRIQQVADRSHDRLARRVPLLYLTPLSWARSTTPDDHGPPNA